MNDKITIYTEISINDLWEAVWGSDGMGMTYWSSQVRKPDGTDIDLWVMPDYEPNPQDFKVYDDEQEKWHTVRLEDLCNGYLLALKSGQNHCGGYTLDLEDPDACFGDMVIQYAIFGELTYG